MTGRDRLALSGIAALAVLALVWLALVSPERDQASKLGAQVQQATAQLASAQSEASSARSAQSRYSSAYASVVSLGKAVPPSEEVPALIYQLAQASNQKHVEFASITNGSATGAGSGSASTSSSATATAAATGAGFKQMPFTFVFNGSFTDLYHLFQQLDAATVRTPSGALRVSGRLLTLQGVKLEPKAGASGGGTLTGTISATAYVLGGSLTGSATATAPSSSAPAASSTASAPSSSSAPAAVITGGPAQ